jgi:DNA repair ATPase RecN
MDAAVVGVVSGLVGALAGAGAAYFGPLQVERRRQRGEQSIRAEEQASMHLDRYVRARTTIDVWTDLLRRAYDDLLHERLDLAAFETEATRHSEQLRSQLADLTHLGIPTTGAGVILTTTHTMFFTLHRATNEIKYTALRPIEERREQLNIIDHNIRRCLVQRNDWALTVLDNVSRRVKTPLHRMAVGDDFTVDEHRFP